MLEIINSMDKGGNVLLSNGTFIIKRNIEMFANTSLIGQGIDQTVIKLTNFATPFKNMNTTKAGLIRAIYNNDLGVGCDNITVAKLTIDGNKYNQNTDLDSLYGRYGLFTEACKNVLFDSVSIINMQGYGFDPHGDKPATWAYNLTIINSIAYDNDWDGFTLDQTDGILIRNCTAYNNGRHGFNFVTGSRNALITDVKTYNNGYYYKSGTKTAKGCGISFQNNGDYGTIFLNATNSILYNDSKAGFCSVYDIHHYIISNLTIYNEDRCFHIDDNNSNLTIVNNDCKAPSFAYYRSNITDILVSNNSFFDTSSQPQPSPSITTPNMSQVLSPEASPMLSPVLSPEASPVMSPGISPEVSPKLSPVLSPKSPQVMSPKLSPVLSPVRPREASPKAPRMPNKSPIVNSDVKKTVSNVCLYIAIVVSLVLVL
jgi:parallel beta-helix repeat protein